MTMLTSASWGINSLSITQPCGLVWAPFCFLIHYPSFALYLKVVWGELARQDLVVLYIIKHGVSNMEVVVVGKGWVSPLNRSEWFCLMWLVECSEGSEVGMFQDLCCDWIQGPIWWDCGSRAHSLTRLSSKSIDYHTTLDFIGAADDCLILAKWMFGTSWGACFWRFLYQK